jgi:pseudouridine-5'-phosphate glycosidase
VPVEDEMPRAEIDGLIAQALAECHERGIHGKDVTPFLLGRIVELSDGRSLETNIALVRSNARLGAAVAVAYQHLTAA